MVYKVFEGKPKFGKKMFYISDDIPMKTKNTRYSPNREYMEKLCQVDNEYKIKIYDMMKSFKSGDVNLGNTLSKEIEALKVKRTKINRGLL